MKEKFTRLMFPFMVVFAMVLIMTSALNAAQDGRQVAVDDEAVTTVQDMTPNASGEVVSSVSDEIQRLIDATGGTAKVRLHRATGVLAFARFSAGTLALSVPERASVEERALAFFSEYGAAFGISDASTELSLIDSQSDDLGMTHLTYQQVYQGVPVWAALLRVHFNAEGELTAVNGVFVPKVRLNVSPMLNQSAVAAMAVADVVQSPDPDGNVPNRQLEAADLSVASQQLLIYHDGLAQGVKGVNHLVYEVTVKGSGVREFVYVDANTGLILERISAIHNALHRVVYNEELNLVWQEGDEFPGTLNQDQQNMVEFTGDSYYLFSNTFGIDSYDNAGAIMQSVNLPEDHSACPNAFWDGSFTVYCDGVTSDETVAHEWAHAYTDFTHGLIYAWQSGALNESYSDIWGEVIDQLNGDGTDEPNTVRTVGVCSEYTRPPALLTLHEPSPIAGTYQAHPTGFGPALTLTGTMAQTTIADDGIGTTFDACTPLINGDEISGTIVGIAQADCSAMTQVLNAQNAGAIGTVRLSVEQAIFVPGSHPSITIPSLVIDNQTGLLIFNELINNGADISATINAQEIPTEESYRWLLSEDNPAFGEALRDMWAPTCKGHPGKVTDEEYWCHELDNGGVHFNSGVPNHGFALLVDGGTYNGQTIDAIGMVKAAHIYWRAQSTYQTPTSYFPDHADALEAACSDLMMAGTNLEGLSVSETPAGPSGEVIMQADCDAVAAMIEAVEFHTDPASECAWEPVLEQEPPAFCADVAGQPADTIFVDDFEGNSSDWTLTNTGVFTEYVPRDWLLTDILPLTRTGTAFFAINDPSFDQCDPSDDNQSGVMYLESPMITIPEEATTPRLAFDHNVTTEAGWDGGNLQISVNGGEWEVIPETHFIYNAYNSTLNPIAFGNTNPLAGQPAFTGVDDGQSFSAWGQSQIEISDLAQPGDTIQVRFAFGVDGCNGVTGWYVDDVNLHTCTLEPSYGVEVSPDMATSDEPGTTVEYSLSVTNTGNTTDTFALTVDSNWTTTLSESSVTLPAGESSTVMASVEIPSDATNGESDTATVTATSQSSGEASDLATLTTTATVATSISLATFDREANLAWQPFALLGLLALLLALIASSRIALLQKRRIQ